MFNTYSHTYLIFVLVLVSDTCTCTCTLIFDIYLIYQILNLLCLNTHIKHRHLVSTLFIYPNLILYI